MSEETKLMKLGSSVLHLDGFGYVFVLHDVEEDPREVIRRYAAGEKVGIGGPFASMEEAKTAGSAALTDVKQRLNARGYMADRPIKA